MADVRNRKGGVVRRLMIHKKLTLISTLGIGLVIVATKALGTPSVVPKAYAIAEINVTDPVAYKSYVDAVTPVVADFGGKYLVRAGVVVPIEGDAPTGRFVIIEFPSLAIARSFETSPQYLKIASLRQRASRSRLFLAEGSSSH
jgi:uncharacterized protein (DUF1330 family)